MCHFGREPAEAGTTNPKKVFYYCRWLSLSVVSCRSVPSFNLLKGRFGTDFQRTVSGFPESCTFSSGVIVTCSDGSVKGTLLSLAVALRCGDVNGKGTWNPG
jgi:hypothetical protein